MITNNSDWHQILEMKHKELSRMNAKHKQQHKDMVKRVLWLTTICSTFLALIALAA